MFRASDDERTSGARGDDGLRFLLADDGERITPSHFFRRLTYGIGQLHALLHMFVDQMSHHLRVRLRLKFIALFLQLLLERLIVFDDPVVHQHAARSNGAGEHSALRASHVSPIACGRFQPRR